MRYIMGDILDDWTAVFNEFAKNEVLLHFACACALSEVAAYMANEIIDINQQELDDAETLSEMRALVYGEGW